MTPPKKTPAKEKAEEPEAKAPEGPDPIEAMRAEYDARMAELNDQIAKLAANAAAAPAKPESLAVPDDASQSDVLALVNERIRDEETRQKQRTFKLRCRNKSGSFPVLNPINIVAQNPMTGQVEVTEKAPGFTLKFHNSEAECPEDILIHLIKKGLVGGSYGPIWLENDQDAARFGVDQGPAIVSGMMGSDRQSTKAVQRPHPEWDEGGLTEIKVWLESGEVPDLNSAMDYELHHRRRPEVMRTITDAMVESEPGVEDEDLAAKVG